MCGNQRVVLCLLFWSLDTDNFRGIDDKWNK